MTEKTSREIGSDARKLEYLSRSITTLYHCLFSNEQVCYGTESLLPEFRITIPEHLKEKFTRQLLDYYINECNVLISNLQLYEL